MAFFFSDNPIALFLALVLTVVVLKIVLGKWKWFSGKKSAYLTLVLIAVIILLVAYPPILQMISFSVPYFVLIALFLFAVGGLIFMLGMPKADIWPTMKSIAIVKTVVIILVILTITWAGSHVFGEKLLKEPSVSITDPMIAEKEPVKIDFAPMFTKQALGLIFIIIVLGMAFLFVNSII